jgi:hypothetical protein
MQFGYINTQVTTALAEQQPVISVDTMKGNWSALQQRTRISPPRQRRKSGCMTS